MNTENKGLNLPAIRKTGELSKAPAKNISALDLNKKSAVSSIIRNADQSVQKDILQREKGFDLVLVGDLTGSMSSYHKLLKHKFEELCKELFPMIDNLRIGIVFYLDHGSGDPYVTRVQKLTPNAQELVQFIYATSTGNGGDTDEAVEDALYDITQNMNWKESNSRSVVIFGDASPHPHGRCPHQHDFFYLTQSLFKKQVTINSVYCGAYSQSQLQKLEDASVGDFRKHINYLEAPNFFSWIANVTGGMVLSIENIEDLVDIIKAAAAKDSGHLDDLEKKMKETSPTKLKLIEIAKAAQIRKNLGTGTTKLIL